MANAFGVSRATASITVRKVATLIVKYMGPNLIKLPTTEDEVRNLASRSYTNHGFPQCTGAIDCTHVPTKHPLENYTDYIK